MYEVHIEKSAERDLKRLDPPLFRLRVEHIRALTERPRPPGSRKLSSSADDWRIRVGDHRILYEIDDRAREVRIMRVRHRREVYR